MWMKKKEAHFSGNLHTYRHAQTYINIAVYIFEKKLFYALFTYRKQTYKAKVQPSDKKQKLEKILIVPLQSSH